ncbi:hypothetical protein HKX48_001342 [Thoreauomyces humboldtii]|nr:hypothetical protein HKX48_001342 [Thoreauomyces humboldtii]
MAPIQLPTVEALIKNLNLQAHPEGGYYAETNRTPSAVPTSDHDLTTSIYYLMYRSIDEPRCARSSLHCLTRATETFYLHPSTASATLVEVDADGVDRGVATARLIRLGWDVASGEVSQHTFRQGVWFGGVTNAVEEGEYTLVGCACAPGFDYKEFQMIKDHPDVVEVLTSTFKDKDKLVWDFLSRLL